MSKKRVLVLDDEQDFCDFVAEVANEQDFETKSLTRPTKFDEVFDLFDPDIVVLDVFMPEADGFDIVRKLVARNADIRLLIITGHDPVYSEAVQMQGSDSGLKDVRTLTKPISVSQLRAALT